MISIKNLSKVFTLSKKQKKEMGPDFIGNQVAAVDDVITFVADDERTASCRHNVRAYR